MLTVPVKLLLFPVRVVVPMPNWFSEPFPAMFTASVAASLWLKLIAPVPAPKAMLGAMIAPAVSLPPSVPIFRLPDDPALATITMPPDAETPPPLATVRLFPEPPSPTVIPIELLHVDPLPVTSAELLEAVTPYPMPPT